ncbi:MAG: DUF1634 domain-containing protein [Sulfolobales archaeon]
MKQKPLEMFVNLILRSSVILSLILIVIGLITLFIRGSAAEPVGDSSGLRFRGLNIDRAFEKITSGDPLGILWIAIASLIGGVIASIAVSAYRAYRLGDKPLAVISIILIIIVMLSTAIGILFRSPH